MTYTLTLLSVYSGFLPSLLKAEYKKKNVIPGTKQCADFESSQILETWGTDCCLKII